MIKSSEYYTLPMKGKVRYTIDPLSQDVWILDPETTDHLVHFLKLQMTCEQLITIANGDSVPIWGSGNITLDVLCPTTNQ